LQKRSKHPTPSNRSKKGAKRTKQTNSPLTKTARAGPGIGGGVKGGKGSSQMQNRGGNEERNVASSKNGGSSGGKGGGSRTREAPSEGGWSASVEEEKENAGELYWPSINDRLEVKKNLGQHLGWQVFANLHALFALRPLQWLCESLSYLAVSVYISHSFPHDNTLTRLRAHACAHTYPYPVVHSGCCVRILHSTPETIHGAPKALIRTRISIARMCSGVMGGASKWTGKRVGSVCASLTTSRTRRKLSCIRTMRPGTL